MPTEIQDVFPEPDGSSPKPLVDSPPTVSDPVSQDQGSKVPGLSKNAQKKAARAERLAAVKQERRARERAAKKEKKRERAEKRAAGEMDPDEEEEKRRLAKRPKLRFGATVVVDLGFDDMMSDKEITSLCSQLAYTYSANRQAAFPFSLIFTSVNGRTYDRLESLGDASYKRWANAKWLPENYESLWGAQASAPEPPADMEAAMSDPGPSTISVPEGEGNSSTLEPAAVEVTSNDQEGSPQQPITKDSFVYLTADTEEELTELKPGETYIIGGICDHNRYKNLCLNKARESGIRTARLPIGRYLASLPTRKVLTVNQVFEILIKWVETKDWEQALYSVIPKRKFHQGGKGNGDEGVVVAAAVENENLEEDSGEIVDDGNEATSQLAAAG